MTYFKKIMSIRHPFLHGMGLNSIYTHIDLFDIGKAMDPSGGFSRDAENLAEIWRAVGGDMRNAMEKHKAERQRAQKVGQQVLTSHGE